MMPDADGFDRRLDAVASLGDPVRRRLYRWVMEADGPVCRDEAAVATGVSRSTAGYHLDKLADAGLLRVRFERRTGRTGPGAGRPAKLYGRPAEAVTVSLPPRSYEMLARLLARAAELDRTGMVRATIRESARALGIEIGTAEPALGDALARIGYEPYADGGVIRLRNCPFGRVAREHRDLVCGANLALVEGLLVARGRLAGCAERDPAPDRCCVAVRAA